MPVDERVGVVLMAYGTPRTRDEVLPYYTDIRRGHPPTEEQLGSLIARYEAIAPEGGDVLSPLAARTEAQAHALQAALDARAPEQYAVMLGLKHAAPRIEDAVADLIDAGVRRIVGLVLAPHWSAFSVGQYVDRLRAAAEPHGAVVTAVDSWATAPAFVEFLARDVSARLEGLPADTTVLFTAHSLPRRILDSADPYPDELRATAEAVAARAGLAPQRWGIAWQSAGRTPEPWLGPDVLEAIDAIAATRAATGVLVCACGFVADHLEVLYDLDIEAAARARQRGLDFARTACVNDDPGVIDALAELVVAELMTHVAVVGGGITGLSAALALTRAVGAVAGGEPLTVTVFEAQDRVGGKIRTTPFAGLPGVDEGADAFLARVPEGTQLAREVGLGDQLTSPATSSAAIWWDGLQRIPDGLVLGMPSGMLSLARSHLLSIGGKIRAATEPLRPRTVDADDSLGAYVRSRFGRQVHERLVDPLIGSIYATDTDHFSLDSVPQIAEFASRSRSVILGARRRPAAPAGPVFFAPTGGVGELVDRTAARVTELGGEIRTGTPCTVLEPDGTGWRVDGTFADAMIFACPAAQASRLLAEVESETAKPLGSIEYADVVLVTMTIPASSWPARLEGLSGYLVPKPVQGLVTAVSFGSQKWQHWRPEGAVLLRISLGRDALPVLHLDDERLVDAAVTEVGGHLDLDLQPTDVRVTRWQRAFPQYRPHHRDLVTRVEADLPASVVLAGASYHGIGIPACIRSGRAAADATADRQLAARE